MTLTELRYIVALAREKYGIAEGVAHGAFVPFTAQTRLSGIDNARVWEPEPAIVYSWGKQ